VEATLLETWRADIKTGGLEGFGPVENHFFSFGFLLRGRYANRVLVFKNCSVLKRAYEARARARSADL
jgi:hypothetical protein